MSFVITCCLWDATVIWANPVSQRDFPCPETLYNCKAFTYSDLTKQIARDYDVLVNEAVALRGTFLIDQKGVVRHQVINDLPLGRNIDEAIRMVDALKFFQENGEVCPAGWSKGKDGMKADAKGVAEYLAKNSEKL